MLDNAYKSEARFLQHLQTQAANIEQYKGEVGATGDVVTEIINDAAVFEFLIETCNLADDFKTTPMGIKRMFFSIKTEPPVGVFMEPPSTAPPAAIIAGAVKHSRERDQRFLHAAGISEAARIAFDLIGEQSDAPSPGSIKPTVDPHAAAGNYEFGAVIGNRQKADMYNILIQRAGSIEWAVAKSGTGKTINVTVTPTTPGQPEVLLVRVQLIKDDANYGVPSDPVFVTVSP